MANAGRVLILAKGAWSATTNYVQLDMVSHNSVAYLARQASVGVDPSTDVAMNYWMPFGSAAQIATTSTPGLVMPDGNTITITNTGLIKAVLGIGDITGVTIASPTNGQVLKYNSTTQKWENSSLGSAANKDATNVITSGSTDLIEAGAVYTANQTLSNQVSNKADTVSVISDVYEVTTPAFSSLPQTFTAQGITAYHTLVVDGYAKFSNPSAQGNDWTVITGENTITIRGIFNGSTATTVTMTLGVKRAITATI